MCVEKLHRAGSKQVHCECFSFRNSILIHSILNLQEIDFDPAWRYTMYGRYAIFIQPIRTTCCLTVTNMIQLCGNFHQVRVFVINSRLDEISGWLKNLTIHDVKHISDETNSMFRVSVSCFIWISSTRTRNLMKERNMIRIYATLSLGFGWQGRARRRTRWPRLPNGHPAPCTLHPAPCTLHPAPCTLNPEPCTLNPEP